MHKIIAILAFIAALALNAQSLPDLSKLDAQLKAVAPIHGVSIGKLDDKATWRVDFKPEATAEQRQAAQAVIDAADVETIFLPPRVWTPFEFFSKFTAAEKKLLKASTDENIDDFRTNIALYQVVYPDSPEMQAAMSYLVSLGIITAERKAAILK